MNHPRRFWIAALFLGLAPVLAAPASAQSFGVSKVKITLVRKLPAMVHLAGTTIKVKVTAHADQSDLATDLQSLLETELLKDDPRLRLEEQSPSTLIYCQITAYSHPQPTTTTRSTLALGKTITKQSTFTRITGSLSVSFQARLASGGILGSDNVTEKYDQEFDSSGNSTSQGIRGSFTGAWNRLRGGQTSEQLNPPTDAELRARLLNDAVVDIASHVVNTNESVEVYLARQNGPIDDGDKQAQAGLWERALETFETAPPLPNKEDDAYRLYNTGVAYEALAYQADDPRTAMKYLDQAAIDYGKAIDAKPEERYFLEPQKRIETAIAHYRTLEEWRNPKPAPAVRAAAAPAPHTPAAKALTNDQVIAMVKAGMDDDTIAMTIRNAKAVRFDLTAAGQQSLGAGGVSQKVLVAMKQRSARSTTPAHHGNAGQ